MKKSKISRIILFWGILLAIAVSGLVIRDRDFSENENRYLKQFPQISWKRLMDGTFQEDFETYLNDQIVLRDFWISAKTAVQKLCGNTDIGGAYLGKDGYDFEKITPEDVDGELFQRNIRAVADYFSYCKESGVEEAHLSFLLLPTSGLVLQEKLPANARMFDQESCIDQVQQAMEEYNFIDVREAFRSASDRQLYYRTDHHWTSDGALIAYKEWCSRTGHSFEGEDMFVKTVVTNRFRGSLHSKILDRDSAYDSIWIYTRKNGESEFLITEDQAGADGFYNEEMLEKKDKYMYFFGGNYGEVQIDNLTGGNGNLLVIKDSFANAFVPLIAEKYEHVYMVDLRYYKGDMQSYLQEHGITDVLVLYNISNFISDKNIAAMLKG